MRKARVGGGGIGRESAAIFFPPPFFSPDRARLIFAFSQRPYHLRARDRLPLVKPANSPPLIKPRPSSETQGQKVGARESLNGRENMTRRIVKNGEKSLWGQCLTRPVPNGRRRPGFWLVPENVCVFLPNQKPEQRRPFGTGGLVRHCPQGLYSTFFTFPLRAIFFRPFRLSLAPTICPWVSEDGLKPEVNQRHIQGSYKATGGSWRNKRYFWTYLVLYGSTL